MKPKTLLNILTRYFQQEPKKVRALMVWGPPGSGKSDIVKQAATKAFLNSVVEMKLRDLDYSGFVKDIRLLLCDPTDLRGLPAIRGDIAIWLPPSFLPKEGRDAAKGAIFLDELPSAPPLVQVSAHRLILDRQVEEYKVPDGWHIIAAGNRLGESVVHKMPKALANRFTHLTLEVDLEDWKEWAYKRDIRPEVVSFLNFRPSLLLDMEASKTSDAYPTPRSWETVSMLLDAKFNGDELLELVNGTVGQGAAAEYIGFHRIYTQIPNPDEILDGKDLVPTEPSTLYALCGALVDRYKRAAKVHAKRLLEYSKKLPDEFAVLLVKDAIKANNAVTSDAQWVTWSRKYGELIL